MGLTALVDGEEISGSLLNNSILGMDDWELKHNFVTSGLDGTVNTFEYILISKRDYQKIPIVILKGSKTDRMDQIALLHLKSKSIGASQKIALTSQICTPYENFLAGIFNVTVIREGAPVGINLSESDANNRKAIKTVRSSSDLGKVVNHPDSSKKRRDATLARKRRDRTKIVHDILELADSYGSLGITKIIYRCNLNYNSAQKIMNELLDRKLLETMPTGGVKNKFKITESGLHFLSDLKKLTLTE